VNQVIREGIGQEAAVNEPSREPRQRQLKLPTKQSEDEELRMLERNIRNAVEVFEKKKREVEVQRIATKNQEKRKRERSVTFSTHQHSDMGESKPSREISNNPHKSSHRSM